MLIGEYNPSIDLKGRLHFPARLRDDLGDRFIVTKGLDNAFSSIRWTSGQSWSRRSRRCP